MERLASRVKESLKFNDVPIFGSYIHFQLVKKKQGFNFHKQNTKYNGPQHFPLRSSSISMLSYSTVHNKLENINHKEVPTVITWCASTQVHIIPSLVSDIGKISCIVLA